MSDPYLGEIRMFGGTFVPYGWVSCDGSLLSINSNQALFAILGTTYGGNGVTTFAVPDLRGRLAVHAGSGPGLTPRTLGQQFGTESVSLNVAQMPSHQHSMTGATTQTTDRPAGAAAAPGSSYGTPTTPMAATQSAGQGLPHENMQPSLAVNFIIATQGIFPTT